MSYMSRRLYVMTYNILWQPYSTHLKVRKLGILACYVQVMLLALQAGGVGLNLTSANHVFMLDIHWNPALEVQAADRCHRVGQTRDVYIHRYLSYYTLLPRAHENGWLE